MNFSRSREIEERLRRIVPGGGHTYAKGADQFPEQSPGVLVRGEGMPRMGRRRQRVHRIRHGQSGSDARPRLSARRRCGAVVFLGTNFTRPSVMELECAQRFLEIVDGADMVKFTKDGSTADTAALKLARAYTGRDLVAICAEHPFFSFDDWFMCTTTMDGGMLGANQARDSALSGTTTSRGPWSSSRPTRIASPQYFSSQRAPVNRHPGF